MAHPHTPAVGASGVFTAAVEAYPSAVQEDQSIMMAAPPVSSERPPLPPPPSESELRTLKMMELRAQALDMGIDADTVEDVSSSSAAQFCAS